MGGVGDSQSNYFSRFLPRTFSFFPCESRGLVGRDVDVEICEQGHSRRNNVMSRMERVRGQGVRERAELYHMFVVLFGGVYGMQEF